MVGLLEPGVRDDQPAVVEHVVADQPVDEGRSACGGTARARPPAGRATRPGRGRPCTLRPLQRAQQLRLVVAGHAERAARRDHPHDQAQHARRVRAAVDQVADEDRRAAFRVRWRRSRPCRSCSSFQPSSVSRVRSSAAQPWTSPMMSNGPCTSPPVVPRPLAHDLDGVDLLGAAQDVDLAEALRASAARATAAGRGAARSHHVRAEVAVGPGLVPLPGQRLGDVEHDRAPAGTSCSLASLTSDGAGVLAGRSWRRRR